MRARAALLLTVFLISAGLPSIGVSAPVDWVVVRVSLPQGTRSVSVGLSGTVTETEGDGPIVVGSAFAAGGPGFTFIDDLGRGGISARVSTPVAGADVYVTPADAGTFRFSMILGVGSTGGLSGTVALLFFTANATLSDLSANAPGFQPSIATGSGSEAIYVAGADNGGLAVDVSLAAAGASTRSLQSPHGLVGGFNSGCVQCEFTWSAPDGETGSASAMNVPLPPELPPLLPPSFSLASFAGPAGAWSWSWTGLNVRNGPSPTIAGAFAPIGDDWALFRPGPIIANPIGGSPPGSPPASPPSAGPKVLAEKKTLPGTGVGRGTLGLALLGLAALGALPLVRSRGKRPGA